MSVPASSTPDAWPSSSMPHVMTSFTNQVTSSSSMRCCQPRARQPASSSRIWRPVGCHLHRLLRPATYGSIWCEAPCHPGLLLSLSLVLAFYGPRASPGQPSMKIGLRCRAWANAQARNTTSAWPDRPTVPYIAPAHAGPSALNGHLYTGPMFRFLTLPSRHSNEVGSSLDEHACTPVKILSIPTRTFFYQYIHVPVICFSLWDFRPVEHIETRTMHLIWPVS